MSLIKIKENPIVQLYDYCLDREYYKIVRGLIFSHREKVRVERLENELVLRIKSEKIPDKIIFNNEEVKLVKVKK